MKKTQTVMAGISSAALMLGLAGCGSSAQEQYDEESDLPPVPDDQSCSEWEWDIDDGVWECEDSSSGHYGHYYYGGRYYSSKPMLNKSQDYMNYKNSASFKGSSSSVSSTSNVTSGSGSDAPSVKGSTGFGSGSKSYGG